MSKAIPFTEEIIRLSQFELTDNLKVCNKQNLLSNLLWISKFAFDKEYLNFKRQVENSSIKYPGDKSSVSSVGTLRKYAKYFKTETGHQEFSGRYPLLKDLQQNYFHRVGEYINTICRHFEEDKKSISKNIFNGDFIGNIERIDVGQGDVHQNGKSTAIIYLNSGEKIVFKPRSGGLDLAFNSFLEDLNSNLSNVDLKTAKIIDGSDYFWMEYIENLPCSSAHQLKSYYFHTGVLLAVVYLLRGKDFHFENIIAHGKHPVIIDTECLFNFTENNEYSLMQTCLLPFFSNHNDCLIDNSGLGASGEQNTASTVWTWTNIGSDECELKRRSGRIIAKNNQPKMDNLQIPPTEYLAQIIDGFTCICNHIMERKDGFNTENPFEVFKNQQVRVLVRTTKSYTDILENSYLPGALFSKKSRKGYIEKGLKEFPVLFSLDEGQRDKLYHYECEAIERMDIPFFTANTSQKYLSECDRVIFDNYYQQTPYDVVMQEIETFSQCKLDLEVEFIKSAISARYDIKPDRIKSTAYQEIDSHHEINRINDKILDSSFQVNDEFHWNSFVSLPNKNPFYDNIGTGFYDGSLGIALFLSSFGAYQKNKNNEKLIEAIIKQRLVEFNSGISNASQINLSIESGVAGIIYCLLKINYPKYERKIFELTSLITEDVIKAATTLDFLSGLSGYLAILVELFRKFHSDLILEKVKWIANYLLSKRERHAPTGKLVWLTLQQKIATTGFAHGNSGIAYSLLKVFEVTGNKVYKEAFYEVIGFEDFYFDQENNNWCDLRSPEPTFQNMWCHGAPGIGLCRLYGYEILKDVRLLKDVERAILSAKSAHANHIDFYCCGNFGRFDFLLEAASVLKDHDLYNYTRRRITSTIKLRVSEGFYKTHYNVHIGVENPSLFKGLSGIGYTLLRVMDPEKFPSLGLLK